MSSTQISAREKLLEMAKRIREKREAQQNQTVVLSSAPIATKTPSEIEKAIQQEYSPEKFVVTDRYGKPIQLNARQEEFVRAAPTGENLVLIGAAGTGKTTCQGAAIQAIIHSGIAGTIQSNGHKTLITGTPGIVICAYTRRAVANIKRSMSADMQANCMTIHKLLQYQPTYEDVYNQDTGTTKTKMQFKPFYTADNPLPRSIHTIVIEESSMLGLELFDELLAALPHEVQFIMLGDIEQLPPVFGPAILGFKLLEWKVIQLTEVYRQALESPILSLAHRILSGNPIKKPEFKELNVPNKLKITPWAKKIDDIAATNTIKVFFNQLYDAGAYNPEEDMILIPFNKNFGTIEVNKGIANHIAKKGKHTVHHVIAGFKDYFYRVGETIMYDKEDAVILDIYPNPGYTGKKTLVASPTLDYWGHDTEGFQEAEVNDDDDEIANLLAATSSANEDRVHKASHCIKIKLTNSDIEMELSTASELNSLLLGYALTVHKAQGSEWRKVYFIMHQTHATMCQRELLYTAVTRAREELYIICEPETFDKGIISQRVKGNTLAEKAEFFKGKQQKLFEEKQQ